MTMRLFPLALTCAVATAAVPARAELPAPVKAMIEAAIATGDPAKVRTVVDLAKQTNPDDAAEVDALHGEFQNRQRELASAAAAKREQNLREAGLFDNWSGRGQIGAFQSSGNSSNIGVTLALALQRDGIDWQHRLKVNTDYQRSNGRTSREQYLAAYEPRFQVNGSLFAYALAQYERDRFQGFSSRYSVSGGLGYKVIDNRSAQLSVKAGPAFRMVDFIDGTSESNFGGLAGLDFDWQLAKSVKFTQDADLVADTGGSATVFIGSNTTSILLTSGLEAKMSDRLTTRLSYTIDYDSNPPAGTVKTDTLSRFTLVYGF